MLTEKQLKIRSKGIGGSEAAAVIGIDDYTTAIDVWLRKTGRLTEGEKGDPAYFGNILEDIVAAEFAKRTGIDVRRHTATIFHPRHPFMLTHLDRRVVGKKRGLECKTINAWSGSKLEEPLDKHVVQCQHAMAVTGFTMFHIAYLVGGQRFVTFEIERDDEMIEMLIDAEREFWRYVERDEQPPIDCDHPKASGIIKRLFPGTNGQTIELGVDLEHWHHVYQESKRDSRYLANVAETAKCHILAAMGENAIGVMPDGSKYTRKTITRKAYEVLESSYVDFRFSNKNT